MKISLLSEEALRIEPAAGMLTIEAPSEEMSYSPFHMMGSGLAVCTYAILQSWASNFRLEADDLSVEVRWTFADKPHRVGQYQIDIHWPSLPPERRVTAERVASLCPVKQTMVVLPEFVTRVNPDEPLVLSVPGISSPFAEARP